MEQILRALERDGRLTPAQIAQETGRPEDEVRTLIAEAEERQILLSFGAKVNWANAGRPNVYALVEVKVQPEENVGYKAVARRLSRFDEVLTCYFMSGEYDLALIVVAPSIHEISDFVGEKVATLHGVQSTVTHVIMRRFKEDGVLLENAAEEDRQKVVL